MNAATPRSLRPIGSRVAAVAAVAAGVLAAVVIVLGSIPAIAGADLAGPTAELDRYELENGERLMVSIGGFRSPVVTISICGNNARRGSADCNMPASEDIRLDPSLPLTSTSVVVAEPPAPCPCLVRVASQRADEIAVARFVLVGHPVADPESSPPPVEPLEVSVVARRAPDGVVETLRSALGGTTPYDVTVTVRNRSTEPVAGVAVAGAVGRDADDVISSLVVDDPGTIEPGQTWETTVRSELPAPVFGTARWRVAVSGSGPSVEAADTTRHVPWLLVALLAFLVIDVLVITGRGLSRRRRQLEPGAEGASATGRADDVALAAEAGWVVGEQHERPSQRHRAAAAGSANGLHQDVVSLSDRGR